MTHYHLAVLGAGTVSRALQALLERCREALAREHDISFTVTGVASRAHGWIVNGDGVDVNAPRGASCRDLAEWLTATRASVLFEAIALDPQHGQPALDYLRTALSRGVHAVSANKGPVVHGYRALTALAAQHACLYRFESSVMDGAPLFSLVRECLPLAGIRAVRGVFTSTATVVLEAIEAGRTFDEGIAHAQHMGIAEADPGYDVDGWDSAVKLCALANVLLNGDLRPDDVRREGIRSLDETAIRRAQDNGRPYRLMGDLRPDEHGVLQAHVAPVQCDGADALGAVQGTTLVTHIEADVFPGGLTIVSHDPDPVTTAYGMLTDFIGIHRHRLHR